MGDLGDFLDELDAAITTASGRLSDLQLRVESVDVTILTEFKKKAEGGLELKVLTLGAARGRETANEVTVTFRPRGLVPAATLESELIDGIEVIEETINGLAQGFAVTEASVQLSFVTTVEGKFKLVIGGEGSATDSHVAKLNLMPIDD